MKRIFRPEEIDYAEGKGNDLARAASYASAFAAREAFCKAAGHTIAAVALSSGFCLTRQDGVPSLRIDASLDPNFLPGGGKKAWVSLSHDGDYAVAVVVVESVAPEA